LTLYLEGNLPSTDNDNEDMGDDVEMFEAGAKTSKSQLVLHECFRTVKEAAAVLQNIVCKQELLHSTMTMSPVNNFGRIDDDCPPF
jgi:hypothetical protein